VLCFLQICACCCRHCLQQKRVASLRTRTVSTVAMIAGFLGVIYAGHVPLVFLVLGLQVTAAAP
jgi:phosphatidate cytidylyltransferase